MARKKKHEEHEEHANHERWVLSYADILTLLLALFIVMFAMSKVDQKKFEEFALGAKQGFGEANLAIKGSQGILSQQQPNSSKETPEANNQPTASSAPLDKNQGLLDKNQGVLAEKALQKQQQEAQQAAQEKQQMIKLREQIEAELKKKKLQNAVQFQLDERGLVVNIVTDKVLFDTGQATLKPSGTTVLDSISPIIDNLPNKNKVTVEGHTDNVPITGTFPSNWELSAARATTVLRRLVADGFPSNRISAAGYADQRPLVPNTSDANKAKNRRVAVVVLPTVPLDAAAPANAGTNAPSVGGNAPSAVPAPAPVAPAAPAVP